MAKRTKNDILRAARRQGWKVSRCRNSHWRLVPPDPEAGIIHAGSTDSDVRARRNLLAAMRRTGCFEWAGC